MARGFTKSRALLSGGKDRDGKGMGGERCSSIEGSIRSFFSFFFFFLLQSPSPLYHFMLLALFLSPHHQPCSFTFPVIQLLVSIIPTVFQPSLFLLPSSPSSSSVLIAFFFLFFFSKRTISSSRSSVLRSLLSLSLGLDSHLFFLSFP